MMIKLKYFYLLFLLFILATSLQSCTNSQDLYLTYSGYHVPDPPKHLVLGDFYSYQQSTNYTCGPAVVMTLMRHYGMLSANDMNPQTEMRIAKEMNTTMLGTSQLDMVNWLQKNGFKVDYGQNVSLSMIIDNLNHGIPTIIAWNDINEHSMLVVGYRSEGPSPAGDKDKIFTADPESSGYVVTNGETISGIDSLSPKQLELNQINARDFFNPTHSMVGMYITAVPK